MSLLLLHFLHCANSLATFLFDTTGAKRKVYKRKTPMENFARCDVRGGLRALHLRKLLKKLDQNFYK
jgi:hypothetical protein